MLINHFFKCVFCTNENKILINEDDRGTLQMKKGDEIPYTCLVCHKKDKIHINKIKAEPSKVFFLFVIIFSILFTVFSVLFLGIIALGVLILPIIVFLFQQNTAKTFNNYKIKLK